MYLLRTFLLEIDMGIDLDPFIKEERLVAVNKWLCKLYDCKTCLLFVTHYYCFHLKIRQSIWTISAVSP